MRNTIELARILSITAIALWSACATPEHPPSSDTGHASETITASNGLMFNSLAPNGIMFNGIMFNGIMFNGIMFNGLDLSTATLNGSSLDAEQEQDLINVLAYVAGCALPQGQTATVFASDGTPLTYEGALGLAPEWYDGSLSSDGERLVSACLAARANALEQTVLVSLRTSSVPTSPQEQDIFTTHEGVFWGNLFGSNPDIYACVVDGGGLSGRVCAESSSCGFTFLGDCSQVCELDPTRGEYVRCWAGGKVGDGDGEEGEEDGGSSSAETNVINTFLSIGYQITYGEYNLCKIEQDGSAEHGQVSCWGDNSHAQLADGTTEPSNTPLPLLQLDLDNASVVAGRHTCVRKRNGELYCWGRNDSGQVSTAVQGDQSSPVYIDSDFAEVTSGDRHTCGRKTDGTIWCWGSNRYGQIGNGSISDTSEPPSLVSGIDAVRLSTSTSAFHTCAIRADGTLRCWGRNGDGQLGADTQGDQGTPVQVNENMSGMPFADVTEVCTGQRHTCARKADGTAWCWGSLGNINASKPKQMPFESTGLAAAPGGLSCGTSSVCFVATDSTVWCAGTNEHGQLGYDTRGLPTSGLHPVQNLSSASFVSAGQTYACARTPTAEMWCWGTEPGPATGRPEVILFPDVTLSIDPVQIPLN